MGAKHRKGQAAKHRRRRDNAGAGEVTTCGVQGQEMPQPGAGPSMEGEVWDIRNRLQENFLRVQALFDQMDPEAHASEKLAAVAELRRHIQLAEKTLERTADREGLARLQSAILSLLEQADPDLRDRLAEALSGDTEDAS